MVAGGVDEQQPGDVELLAADQLLAHLVDVLYRDLGGTDVLGDRPGLACLDGCSPDAVEKLSLSMVDMTKDTDNGLPYRHVRHLLYDNEKGVWDVNGLGLNHS